VDRLLGTRGGKKKVFVTITGNGPAFQNGKSWEGGRCKARGPGGAGTGPGRSKNRKTFIPHLTKMVHRGKKKKKRRKLDLV